MQRWILMAAMSLVVASAEAAPKSHKGTQARKPSGACENVDMLDTAKVIALIKKAKTCDAAVEIVHDCALGASGDMARAETAARKCESKFAAHDAAYDKTYADAQKLCDKQYDAYAASQGGTPGTMFISMYAFCKLNVAQTFHGLFAPMADIDQEAP